MNCFVPKNGHFKKRERAARCLRLVNVKVLFLGNAPKWGVWCRCRKLLGEGPGQADAWVPKKRKRQLKSTKEERAARIDGGCSNFKTGVRGRDTTSALELHTRIKKERTNPASGCTNEPERNSRLNTRIVARRGGLKNKRRGKGSRTQQTSSEGGKRAPAAVKCGNTSW